MKTIPPKRGVVYCAVSTIKYLEAALISAIALRELEPDLPIVILTNLDELQSLGLEQFNITLKPIVLHPALQLSHVMESRLIKTSLLELTNFDETLYLDADVLPLQSIASIWSYLDKGSVAMAVDINSTLLQCDHVSQEEKEYTLKLCPASATQFNGGVMLWKNTKEAANLFRKWKQEWLKFKAHDQLALIRAIHSTQTPIIEIPKIYNYPIPQFSSTIFKQGQVRLLHCWGGFIEKEKYTLLASMLLPNSTATALKLLKGFL